MIVSCQVCLHAIEVPDDLAVPAAGLHPVKRTCGSCKRTWRITSGPSGPVFAPLATEITAIAPCPVCGFIRPAVGRLSPKTGEVDWPVCAACRDDAKATHYEKLATKHRKRAQAARTLRARQRVAEEHKR